MSSERTLDSNTNTPTDQLESGYDVLAKRSDNIDRHASPWGDSHFQQCYSWPTTRPVLPRLTDNRVLLAGCGRGDHVPWFSDHGASVVGVDISEAAIREARQQFGDVATFHSADLTRSLDFADADSFDLVFSNLVMSHIEEWQPVFEEFHRVLVPQGDLVVATIHPRYIRSGADIESYYTLTQVMNDWPEIELPTFYRPMNAVITSFVDAGFRLRTFEEPEPPDAYEEYYPERYRKALNEPEILVVRAQADREAPSSVPSDQASRGG